MSLRSGLGGGQARGKSGAGGGALRAGLPPARLRAGACPRAQVGTAQPPRGAAPRPRETARPFPLPDAGRQPPPRPLVGRGGPRPPPPPAPTARVERRRWQRRAAYGLPPPAGDSPASPPKTPHRGREGCWPGGAHAWGRRNSSGSRSRRPGMGPRRGHVEAPGGKLQPIGQRAQLPSGSRAGAPLHARPSQAPLSPGREETSPGKPLSQVPRGRTRPSRWAHRLPGALGRTTSRAGPGARGRRQPPHPRRILLRPEGKRTELGVRLAVGTAPELGLGRRDPPGPPGPLLNRGDGGREKRRAWRSPQPCCFLFHALKQILI